MLRGNEKCLTRQLNSLGRLQLIFLCSALTAEDIVFYSSDIPNRAVARFLLGGGQDGAI